MALRLWSLDVSRRLGGSQNEYERLPTTARSSFYGKSRQIARSRLGPLLIAVVLLIPPALFLFVYRSRRASALAALEPSYEEFYKYEQYLPQHDESLPFPEGKDGRYVWVSTQHWGLGWNNVFQAYCLLTQMAFMSNRAFAFKPYVWRLEKEGVVDYYGEKRANQIPLSAILGGPLGGGSLPHRYHRPRSVSVEWFHHVCPPNRTTVFDVLVLNEGLGDDASKVMEKYVDVLKNSPANCIELRSDGLSHPFDWMHFGSPKLLNLWETLRESPFFTDFSWSPLVISAFPTNLAKLSHNFLDTSLSASVPKFMTVHLRRGDYAEHCHGLAEWSSRYMGWNLFPSLPDQFNPPPKGSNGEITSEYNASYSRHCYPNTYQIIRRIHEVRREWKAETGEWLTHLYIMTNGEESWLRDVIQRLHSYGKWERISTGRDLTLTAEQTYVSQIIDMAIGERASVFLGNGFSSFTANIVFLRSLRNLSMRSNRFW